MTTRPASATIRETCLYVGELARAVTFYRGLLNYAVLASDDRFCALDAGGDDVLLLFLQGATTRPAELPGGTIPSHDGRGPAHIGFGVELADLDNWIARLTELNITIESRMSWPRGGRSIFFRDPDGHLVELLTRGTWKDA
jgi:catechol 2,3-dioxygenase-like lactoylglutathione lyase family enzyme